jgi:adenylate cyclase
MSLPRLFDRDFGEGKTPTREGSPMPGARHLAAVLAVDVVGYSRLMGAEEERTHERLKDHFRQLVYPKIKEHHGRIVKTTGDGMLVEFPSVIDAVRCAVEVQRGMVDRNADIVEDKRITFRIGVNLGDVIADGGDIYGDGVNIAARLETLAEPGGICISRTVRDHIRDKLPYVFEDLGEQAVKNIARPLRVYAMDANAIGSMPPLAAPTFSFRHQHSTPRHFLAAASIIAVIGLGLGGWLAWPNGNSSMSPVQPSAPITQRLATVAPGAPATQAARLSIVVLPFANLSNDPEQDYFVDAITDDLTTDLSRISESFVIARNTAFTYKGKAVDAKQVSLELGVRYVLEGSVRRLGDRAQVNVQLIDGETGAHIWADRFDTDRKNLAEAQTEITGRLARTLHLELVSDAARRIEQEHAVDPNARDFVMRGWASWYGQQSRAKLQEAQQAFERAFEIDSRSIDARIGIGLVLAANVGNGFSNSVEADKKRAEELLVEAIQRDPNRSMAHAAIGLLRTLQDRQAEALVEYRTAVALDPNNAWALRRLGQTFMFMGEPEPCVPYIEKALNPGVWYVHLKLAGTLGLKGEIDEARAEAREMVRLKPDMNSVARVRGWVWYRNPQFQVLHDRTIIQGLRNIGFPEEVAAQ